MAALPRLAISKCLFVVPEVFVLLIFATTFLPEDEDEETLASLRTPAMPLCDLPSVAFFTSFTALLAPFDEDDDFFESDDIPLLDDVDAFPEEDSTPPRRSKPSKAAMRFVEARRIIFREIVSSSSSFNARATLVLFVRA